MCPEKLKKTNKKNDRKVRLIHTTFIIFRPWIKTDLDFNQRARSHLLNVILRKEAACGSDEPRDGLAQ